MTTAGPPIARSVSRGAGTDDDHRPGNGLSPARSRRLCLATDDDASAHLLHGETAERIESGCRQHFSRAQVEARVVAGAADGLSVDRPVGEMAAVVSARRAHREEFQPAPRDEHGLPLELPDDDPAVG